MQMPHHFDLAPDDWAVLRRLLDEALDMPAEARPAWFDALGPEHAAFKPRLHALLSHADEPRFEQLLQTLPKIDTSAFAGPAPPHEEADSQPERHVGPYRLLRQIGEGGMAAVWLAERTDVLQGRQVALKLPHVSLHRSAWAERLVREREILATLNHPNIARLYDAGITADGQPYLALEYVEGQRIDMHCRERKLGLRERLQLFLQVTRAVAHAHARLVVHRDLKPSNILIGADGQARLLDFGIAKLLEQGLAQETALTLETGRALTPDYAAPEQIRGEPIGTAADIYSLGVVLFELVTGERPYKLPRDSRAALEEAILQAEPPRPSSVVADARQRRQLRGDLDTIVQKALKKDVGQRYVTVDALAEDITRYLADEPVHARPDSRGYVLRKFITRHKIGAAASAAVLSAVLAGAAAALWQARVARAEQQRAEQVKDFIASIFREADPYTKIGKVQSARDLLLNSRVGIEREFSNRPALQVELLTVVGDSLKNLGDLPAAESTLQQAIEVAQRTFDDADARSVEPRVVLAETHGAQGRTDVLGRELAELLPLARQAAISHPHLLVRVLENQAHFHFYQGNFEAMGDSARQALELARRRLGEHHPQTLKATSVLAESFVFRGQPVDAMLEHAQGALRLALAAHADRADHPDVLRMRDVYGRALAVVGRFHEAIEQLELAHAGRRRILGTDVVATGLSANNVAPYLRRVGDIKSSLAYSDEALATMGRHLDAESVDLAFALTTRGVTLISARRPLEALSDLQRAEKILLRRFGATHWETLTVRYNAAIALAQLGRIEDAVAALSIGRDPSVKPQSPMWMRHVEGTVARLGGQHSDAIASQSAALELIKPGPKADWDRMRVLMELGLAQLGDEKRDAARESLTKARELAAALRAKPHPAYAETLTALARLDIGQHQHARAIGWLQEADAFWRDFDAGHRGAGEAALWLSRGHAALGQQAAANAAQARAARILGPRTPPARSVSTAERRAPADAPGRPAPQRTPEKL
jgi:serine/threonine protein kinase